MLRRWLRPWPQPVPSPHSPPQTPPTPPSGTLHLAEPTVSQTLEMPAPVDGLPHPPNLHPSSGASSGASSGPSSAYVAPDSRRRTSRLGGKLGIHLVNLGTSLWGSILFYTALPLPHRGATFQRIARFAPLVGLGLGLGLIGLDYGLAAIGIPTAPRSALLVVLGVWLTGGLHLDGAMDTADGLGVTDPQRRLQVMADSRAGAFGVMVAIAILLLKFAALVSIPLASKRALVLLLGLGWGRWGQVWAIAHYPYLKPEGKGAMHKSDLQAPWDWLLGLGVMIGVAVAWVHWHPYLWRDAIGLSLGGFAIALLLSAWFNARLGGHTGDSYGAIVEWAEALILCLGSGL